MRPFDPVQGTQMFCSPVHRDAWNNRATVRGNRSARSSKGRWLDGDLVRFRDGVPAQVGGWSEVLMPRGAPSIRDVRGLDSALASQQAALDQSAQEDVVIDGARRLMLRSPNGTYWAITVSDNGALSTINMGTVL